MAAIEIPCARQDVVFRYHAPAPQGPRLTLEIKDPVNQHQRLVRQAHTRRVRVDLGPFWAQRLPDRAHGELEALVAVHREPRRLDRTWRRRRRL